MTPEAKEARRAYQRAYLREYREKNREKVNEQHRLWCKNNPEKVKAAEQRFWEKKYREMMQNEGNV